MVAKSHAVARALDELQIAQRCRVGVLHQPTVDWLICMLGIWRAGFSYVPLEITQGTGRLASIAREAQLAVIIFHEETKSSLRDLDWEESIRTLNSSSIQYTTSSTEIYTAQTSAEDEAMVFYTSGSTGVPKVRPTKMIDRIRS